MGDVFSSAGALLIACVGSTRRPGDILSLYFRGDEAQLQEEYDVGRKIADGDFCSVSQATHRTTLSHRAVKSVAKRGNLPRLRAEVEALEILDHPNIVKLFDIYEDKRMVYLATELCRGGELFERILEAGFFTEMEAATVMRQVIQGVAYMHSRGVCHRDLRPENLLLVNQDPIEGNTLKIINFSVACAFEEGRPMTSKVGAHLYVAPQVLDESYNELSDVWSCGVIMYILLCGDPPFSGETDAAVLQAVKRAHLDFDPHDWRPVSPEAKQLVIHMVEKDPARRFSAKQALQHNWIQTLAPNTKGRKLQGKFFDKLRTFRCESRLKKVALRIISKHLTDEQIGKLKSTFEELDADHSGTITLQELEDGMQSAGIGNIDLQELMADLDADGNGQIDYAEFLAATMKKRTYMRRDVCWAAFCVFDQNGDGKISKEELQLVLKDEHVQGVAGAELENMMTTVDADGDNMIDFEEFMSMMEGQ